METLASPFQEIDATLPATSLPTMNALSVSQLSALALLLLPLSGCITKRTVTQGGQTVESGYVVKRPIKEAIENTNKDR